MPPALKDLPRTSQFAKCLFLHFILFTTLGSLPSRWHSLHLTVKPLRFRELRVGLVAEETCD
jgi:hypothetical protein